MTLSRAAIFPQVLSHTPVLHATGQFLSVQDLVNLLVTSKALKDAFSNESIWHYVAIVRCHLLPPFPPSFYALVKRYFYRVDDKAKIGKIFDKLPYRDVRHLDYSFEDRMALGRDFSFEERLPTLPYSQIVSLIQRNLEKLLCCLDDFCKEGLFDIVLLFEEIMNPRTRCKIIEVACLAKRFDLVPQLRLALVDPIDRRNLFSKRHCKDIRDLLRHSNEDLFDDFLHFTSESEMCDFIRRIYFLDCLDVIQEISPRLGEQRGQLIIYILKDMEHEDGLESAHIILESGDISIADREEIMQLACNKGRENLFRMCIGMGWGISDENRKLFIIGVARSGNMRMLLGLFKDAIPTLDQGARGLAIAEAAKGGHEEIAMLLMPERMVSSDRANCVVQALRKKHLKLAHSLLYSGKIENHDEIIVEAAKAGSLDIVSAFSNISHQTRTEAIRGASINNHAEVVKFLRPQELTADERGFILYNLVMDSGRRRKCFSIIFHSGPIDKQSQELAFYRALDFNIPEFFQPLLELGLPEDLEMVGKCVVRAAEHGLLQILEMLLKVGKVEDRVIEEAILQAIRRHIKESERFEIFELLSPTRMSPGRRGVAVYEATHRGNRKLIKILLDSGEIPLEGYGGSREEACLIAIERSDAELLRALQPELLPPHMRARLLSRDPACVRVIMNSGPVPLYEWRSALKYASDSENEELVNALKKRPQELFEEELCEAAKWGNAKKLAKYIQSSGLTEKLRERAILAALEVVPEAIEEVLELLSVKLLSSKLRKILILKLLRGYVGARSVALFILRSAPLEENEYEEIEKAISELPIADKEERDKKALQEMLEIINKLKNK